MRRVAALVLALGAGPALGADAPSFEAAVTLARKGEAPAAAAMFRALAEEDSVAAQANLAVMLARGQGLPQDDLEAAYWAWRARLGGEARAIALAEHLLTRLTDEARADLAERLATDLGEMSAAGDRAALLGLGRIAAQLRQPPDHAEALKWYSIAAALGVPGAASLRDILADEMPAADRLDVQAGAREAFAEWCGGLADGERPETCPGA
ncbi:SEL1-like repeat protein [Roseovarius aquimarinus]|uniref:Sel1 repeat family protein n=1 Tax=Roseovarius aquimarinus TaxID=1229156 RepID=A0ABW7I5T7_9RHOB